MSAEQTPPVENILLVDHIEPRRLVVQQLLAERGYNVVAATSCEDALQRLAVEEVTLILTETELPAKSGLFLLKIAKETNPEIEVILLTHNASSYNLMQALRLGAYDFIVRPIDTGEVLYNAVDRALNHIRLRVQNKLLLTELEEQNRSLQTSLKMMKALNDSIERLADKVEIEDLLAELVSSAMRETGSSRGCIILCDRTTTVLRLKVCEGINEEICRKYASGIPAGLVTEIARRDKPLMITAEYPPRIRSLETEEERDYFFAEPGLIVSPLRMRGRLVGTLILSGVRERAAFNEHDLHFAIQLAHHATLALEKAGIIHRYKRGKVSALH
ncbi:MAG: response regulator [Desulfuromonadales bacterium]|nr:response regulator [Desulfuromonadales bacterium]